MGVDVACLGLERSSESVSTGSTTPTRSGAALPSEFSDPAIQQLMAAGSVRPLSGDEVRDAFESSKLSAARQKAVLRALEDAGVEVQVSAPAKRAVAASASRSTTTARATKSAAKPAAKTAKAAPASKTAAGKAAAAKSAAAPVAANGAAAKKTVAKKAGPAANGTAAVAAAAAAPAKTATKAAAKKTAAKTATKAAGTAGADDAVVAGEDVEIEDVELVDVEAVVAEVAEVAEAVEVVEDADAEDEEDEDGNVTPRKPAAAAEEESDDAGFVIRDDDEEDAPAQQVVTAGATADPVKDYLKQIGKVALLNAEQEVELAKRIEAGLFAEERLNSGDKIDMKLKRELWWIAQDGKKAKNHLLEANLRLVVSLAKRYTGRGMLFLDLIQEGNLGLIRAVEKFDYTKGYKFST